MKKEKFSQKNIAISAAIPKEARKAPFWKRVLELLSRSSRGKKGVNISKIAAYTKEGKTAVVPDKVLGTGSISHKITVGAVSYSKQARAAIEKAGGNAASISDIAKRNLTGKDIVIIR